MATSASNLALRARRRERALRWPDATRERMLQLAEAAIRDFAATHGLSYRDARERLRAAAHAGRTRVVDPGDG